MGIPSTGETFTVSGVGVGKGVFVGAGVAVGTIAVSVAAMGTSVTGMAVGVGEAAVFWQAVIRKIERERNIFFIEIY